LGITALYVTEYRTPIGAAIPVLIELHPVTRRGSRGWIVEGVHPPKRVKLPPEYTDALLQRMGDLGALVTVDPASA
jgi:hypothetical protein